MSGWVWAGVGGAACAGPTLVWADFALHLQPRYLGCPLFYNRMSSVLLLESTLGQGWAHIFARLRLK